jgi:hypothetical protein
MIIGLLSLARDISYVPGLILDVPSVIKVDRKSEGLYCLLTCRYTCLISSTHLLFDKIK